MTSSYLETETLRTAMERALNAGRPATLSNPESCRRAYERADIEHYGDADHVEAVRRALQWRCWNAEKHLGIYEVTERIMAPVSFVFLVAVWAIVYCIVCPGAAHAADGPSESSSAGYLLAVMVGLVLAGLAVMLNRREVQSKPEDFDSAGRF